jgi:CheY-like chemotaxis protein
MLRILVVEDNPDLRETLSLLLEADDRHIEAAANAEDALRLYTAQPFDVVFSDVKLPGMSGLELADRLLAAGVRVVVMSGHGEAVLGDELPPGVRILDKPFGVPDLKAAARRALSER